MQPGPQAFAGLGRLLAIMARLRDPEYGCPWDREQDFASIAPYTIEEAYEVADAIARADWTALKDELGDLLFQVVFHARMAEEAGLFSFAEVAGAVAEKMVRRHPHVFGTEAIGSAAAQSEAWEEQKASERRARAAAAGRRESVLDGVALALPALLRAAKIQARAARIGFDWTEASPVVAKLVEEIAELEAELAIDCDGSTAPEKIEDEMGDILFAAVNLARKLDIDPEGALRRATAKFERRFREVEALAAERGTGRDLEGLEALWREVKGAAEPVRPPQPITTFARVNDALPIGIDGLRAEARAEDHRMLDILVAEWNAGTTRFDQAGEALFAAYANGDLAAIGGLTSEWAIPGALRMRRFYVGRAFRRRGIGRRLVQILLDRPEASGRPITANAATASKLFWESLGFIPDERDGHTHILPDTAVALRPQALPGT